MITVIECRWMEVWLFLPQTCMNLFNGTLNLYATSEEFFLPSSIRVMNSSSIVIHLSATTAAHITFRTHLVCLQAQNVWHDLHNGLKIDRTCWKSHVLCQCGVVAYTNVIYSRNRPVMGTHACYRHQTYYA
jgi:hypothetical protein